MDITPKLDLVVIDCPDALELARFYAGILDWGVDDAASRDWATLLPPGGRYSPDHPDGHTTLVFQRIDDWVEPTWPGGAHPQQMHLDLFTPDMDASERAVVSAGARKHDHQPSTDDNFRVFLDPAGHPFCLIRG